MTRPVSPRPFSTNGYRVRPQKMADMVAGRIRQMIARGEITDGEWLPTEPELMEQFGVSRPTLREAFRLLESDSLVTIRRGPPGGARVTVPGPEQRPLHILDIGELFARWTKRATHHGA